MTKEGIPQNDPVCRFVVIAGRNKPAQTKNSRGLVLLRELHVPLEIALFACQMSRKGNITMLNFCYRVSCWTLASLLRW